MQAGNPKFSLPGDYVISLIAKQFLTSRVAQHRAAGTRGARGLGGGTHMPPSFWQISYLSLNQVSKLCQPHYYVPLPPRIFRPSYGLAEIDLPSS